MQRQSRSWLQSLPASDAALAIGATMRLSRAVVVDDIGKWLIKQPIDKKIDEYNDRYMSPWWRKYRSALDCPFCIGFHIGWLVLASYFMCRRVNVLPVWRFVAGALSLNHVSAHIATRIGDVEKE